MTKLDDLRKRNLWLLFAGLFLSLAAAGLYYRSLEEQSARDIKNISTIYSARTESLINTIFHKTDVLAAVVKLRNGKMDDYVFDSIAKLVYQEDSGIRGIQYMPGAVVTNSYPVEGNEGVMGKNFLEIPERRKDVLLAIDTKSIALSGPYHLIQGGLGVVARNPIFLTNAVGEEYFWGFSAIILDLPKALDGVALEQLFDYGYDYQLYCINENDEKLVIAGNPKLDIREAVCDDIQVPHHIWTLAITRTGAWINLFKAGAVFLFGILLSVILWLQYSLMMQKDAAIRAKDRFFSDVSHDMRTPLNAIIGFSVLAQREQLSGAEKDTYLGKIESSGKLLLELVNDILTLSRAGQGKLQMHPAAISVQELVESVFEPIRMMAAQKKIALHLDLGECQQKNMFMDSLSVRKILLNLLNNAVKYTRDGGNIWTTVRIEAADTAERSCIIFEIRDDGIGICKDFLPHIFEPFTQEQRSGYEGLGNGLGLSIVRQLTELMHGHIAVRSEENQGTTFTVKIPAALTERASVHTSGEVSALEVRALSGKKLLICEDNALNREILCELLESNGIVVDSAENGQVGVDKFCGSRIGEYSGILMDIRMPVMNGCDAARAIRGQKRPDAGKIPILAVTADGFSDDMHRCMKAGMNGYILKPIDMNKIMEVLASYIKE